MKNPLLLFFILLFAIDENAASQYLQIFPQKPQPGQQIQFQYNPADTRLSSSLIVRAKLYIFEETGRFIKPTDILLSKKEGFWTGQFDLVTDCVAFALVFKDEREIPDTNNGDGYVYYLHNESGEMIKGAKASIAKYYAQGADFLNLKIDTNQARSLFDQEFKKNKDLMPYFISPYSYTFNLNDPIETAALLAEVDALYSKRQILDEHTLYDMYHLYRKLNLKEKSNECIKYLTQNYPDGKWAFQLNSRPFQEGFHQSSELNKKM